MFDSSLDRHLDRQFHAPEKRHNKESFMNSERHRGKIKRILDSGSAFIARDDGEHDVFAHGAALRRSGATITEGDAVTFAIVSSRHKSGATEAAEIRVE